MKKQIYAVDNDGFITEIYVGEFDDSGNLTYPVGDYVTIDPPQPLTFYKPRWNGSEWVEGESAEERNERESLVLLDSMKPSKGEIDDAELEIKIITLLMEMGLV